MKSLMLKVITMLTIRTAPAGCSTVKEETSLMSWLESMPAAIGE